MQQGEEIVLFTSSVMWAVRAEDDASRVKLFKKKEIEKKNLERKYFKTKIFDKKIYNNVNKRDDLLVTLDRNREKFFYRK